MSYKPTTQREILSTMSCAVKRSYRAPLALVAILAALLLIACQPEAPEPELSDEEVVSQRAQACWQAMVERDFERAWEYTTPGFRQETPSERYAASHSSRRLQYLDARVASAECEGDRCEVA